MSLGGYSVTYRYRLTHPFPYDTIRNDTKLLAYRKYKMPLVSIQKQDVVPHFVIFVIKRSVCFRQFSLVLQGSVSSISLFYRKFK